MSETMEMTNAVQPEKRLTKKDLIKTFILWETVTETCLSYERLMSLRVLPRYDTGYQPSLRR